MLEVAWEGWMVAAEEWEVAGERVGVGWGGWEVAMEVFPSHL